MSNHVGRDDLVEAGIVPHKAISGEGLNNPFTEVFRAQNWVQTGVLSTIVGLSKIGQGQPST